MALARSDTDRILAGVCGGLAAYLKWDPTLVRVIYALLTIFSVGFPGIIVYLVLWILMPPSGKNPGLTNLELK